MPGSENFVLAESPFEERARFAVFNVNNAEENFLKDYLSHQEYLRASTMHMPLSESVFFENNMEKMYFPVLGPKRAHDSKYQILDQNFTALQSFKISLSSQKELDQIGLMTLLESFLSKNGVLGQKKLLLELNSRDLALHFFL